MRRQKILRSFACVFALAVLLAACGEDEPPVTPPTVTGTEPPQLGGKLVISNWDLYMPKSIIRGFERESGVDVEVAIHTTNEDIMGKLQASNGTGFDVVFVSGPFVQQLVGQGWAAAIDPAKIPNLANLYPEATQLGYDPGNTHSVPYAWGTTGICYRTDLVDEPPTGWEVFRDPPAGLEGKMTMLGTDRWLLQPALLDLGYSINTTDPAQIDEAQAWTEEAKANLLAFDDTTFYSKLVDGQASLVHGWDGWCNYGIAEEPKIDFVIPEEGSDVWTDTMVILESSENKDAAHAFIDYVLRPESGAAVVGYVYYKVPNGPAMDAVDPELLEQFPTLSIAPAELFEQEAETDLGAEGTVLWSEAVTQVKAA